MNVVLVILDSLRKDCVGAYGSPPWGEVKTPHLDALAGESLVMDRAYPESLPTLPARRAIYTGRAVYPFFNANFHLKGDFVGAPGWGPIPEEQTTMAEAFRGKGFRTGLISDVYHMFKPSKNFWRGFDQWMFLRGQEIDPYRSGPEISQEQVDYWLPKELQTPRRVSFLRTCLRNMHDRTVEEDYFCARVFTEAARWLEQNLDADRFFLTVESFDPHEPWFVPEYYRRMYDDAGGREQVLSAYADLPDLDAQLVRRTQANYSGLVTMCDRWFGYLYEAMDRMGLLENTLLMVTSDHGHSIDDRRFLGKRGYPSHPSVIDIPLMVRFPDGTGAGRRSDAFVQHQDIPAELMARADVKLDEVLDGRPFADDALAGQPVRDHATVAWGTGITVVNADYYFNCKADGTGPFLYDLHAPSPFDHNVADEHPQVVRDMFHTAVDDAGGEFPDYILDLARESKDAPGCSALAARPS